MKGLRQLSMLFIVIAILASSLGFLNPDRPGGVVQLLPHRSARAESFIDRRLVWRKLEEHRQSQRHYFAMDDLLRAGAVHPQRRLLLQKQ